MHVITAEYIRLAVCNYSWIHPVSSNYSPIYAFCQEPGFNFGHTPQPCGGSFWPEPLAARNLKRSDAPWSSGRRRDLLAGGALHPSKSKHSCAAHRWPLGGDVLTATTAAIRRPGGSRGRTWCRGLEVGCVPDEKIWLLQKPWDQLTAAAQEREGDAAYAAAEALKSRLLSTVEEEDSRPSTGLILERWSLDWHLNFNKKKFQSVVDWQCYPKRGTFLDDLRKELIESSVY